MNLLERDRQYIWHPFTPQKNMPSPIAITKGKGSLLFDENNKSYIDVISSWWVNLHGHAHPYIAEKLYQQALQLEQVIFAGFTHQPAVDLAEQLIALHKHHFSKIFFSDNGSTSTEVALKMAIQYWWNKSTVNNNHSKTDRHKILAFKNSYHGDTFGAMSVSERSVFTLAFQDLFFEVAFIDTPDEENIQDLKTFVEKESSAITAFIYEPLVQGAGGMKMYEAYWMNELLTTVKEAGIICIADEVMTGFGRTGKMFASEYITVKPDILCMSKGLTGGTMALGATACTEKIYEAYVTDDKLKTFFHGHSFTANPLACTAAIASIELLKKEECLKQIEHISERNEAFKFSLSNQIKGIKNIRSIGTILAFEIDKGADEYLNNVSSIITEKCLSKGVYLRPLGNTVYIMPPYCITDDQLDRVYNVIEEVINDNKN